MQKFYIIGSEILTTEIIDNIVRQKMPITLDAESWAKIQKSSNYLDKKLKESDKAIYGVNTGFGALHNVRISEEELSQLQENLIKSHACGVGDEVNDEIVKIMMLLKIKALSLGHSAVQRQIVERIIDFFNKGIIPIVYEQGSLGASGDLAPLAHLFLPILGIEGQVRYEGKVYSFEEINRKFNYKPIKLNAKEGLALLNGTQFMSAYGVYCLIKAKRLIDAADKIAAISLDAYDCRIEPFDELLHKVRPHKGQIQTARNIREYLKDSEIQQSEKKHVQDPYSFRCIPQVHGAVKDAFEYVKNVVEIEINSVTDNPTVFVEEDKILSGGNFHGEPLALAFDFLAIALSELASISERRIYRLISGERGLPVFLVKNPGINSGFMIPQYTAASIVSQNKQLATPASVDSISSSKEQEDHVSMGANAATKLKRVVENTQKVLAIELFNAAQALEFRKPLKTSPLLQKIVDEYRKVVPFVENDTFMADLIKKSIQFLDNL